MNSANLHRLHTACKLFFAGTALMVLSITGRTQTNIAVAPLKMNVLYIGIDNPVSIAASGSTDDKVTVSITGGDGTVSKMDAGLYNVRVLTVTDDCQLNVYVNGKLAGTSHFRVRPLPQPSGSVGGFVSGAYIDAAIFKSQPGLGVYIQNFPFEMNYEVLGFSVVLMDDKGNLRTAECRGNLFSDVAKQYLSQYVKTGDIVTIENIRVKAPGGKELRLPSLLYNIR